MSLVLAETASITPFPLTEVTWSALTAVLVTTAIGAIQSVSLRRTAIRRELASQVVSRIDEYLRRGARSDEFPSPAYKARQLFQENGHLEDFQGWIWEVHDSLAMEAHMQDLAATPFATFYVFRRASRTAIRKALDWASDNPDRVDLSEAYGGYIDWRAKDMRALRSRMTYEMMRPTLLDLLIAFIHRDRLPRAVG